MKDRREKIRRRLGTVFALISLALSASLSASAAVVVAPGGGTPDTSQNFTLVGHDPLFNRGMNAALAIFDHFVYIGNRTDGSATCGRNDPRRGTGVACPHSHPGVLIVDVADPAHPNVVGEIGPPFAGLPGITTRELRVWPEKKLLMIMTFRCSSVIHACPPGNDTIFPFDIKFFSLADPIHPQFISSYVPTSKAGAKVKPHEMFLWVDPQNPDRALLWLSTPSISANPARPNLMIVDISQVPSGGAVVPVAEGNWNNRYPGTSGPNYPFRPDGGCGPHDCNLFIHSVGLTADGTRTFLAMEAGHFLVLDTSQVAEGVANPRLTLLTDPTDRPTWEQTPPDPTAVPNHCAKACPNSHSAVKVPGRPFALTTDEVYGTFTDPSFGCPWGWARLIDIEDPAHPSIVGEYKIAQDDQSFCGSAADDPATEQFTSYSSHNPTVLGQVALIAWHSGGLQAINIADPRRPSQAGWFSPAPLALVATEDPALSRGANKVVFWSYPIIRDGLIYVIDVRNGLYSLRYTGFQNRVVAHIGFLEGNSNLGDAVRLDESND